ncbi:N-acetylmannosamine-6-phosphate 2-epimerase [Consotaella aegiceratis]|uniref:N-acetylmannosamine-6-phosphate 2-epimerase n=1 Tax=Consotaella aegiceratis TaxID=3097961 RepID=UPI003D8078D9
MPFEDLRQRLVVSCQPVPGGPFDRPEMVVAFALAALAGGARGLRIESARYVAAVRAVTAVPIIGLVKRDLAESPVRITPTIDDARALVQAGADIVAFDATRRIRPTAVPDLVAVIKKEGALAMADCSCASDGQAALAAGADIVGSTLSGYTGGAEPIDPDLDLVAALRRLTENVVAEGRIHTPDQAAAALRSGAFCVVVGSAITRPEHITGWFAEAIDAAGGLDQAGAAAPS